MNRTAAPDRVTRRASSRRAAALVAMVAVLLVVAACGSDDDTAEDPAGGTDASTPATDAGAPEDGEGPGDATTSTTPASEGSLLGTPDPAEGEPVKVGFVSDGQTVAFDNTFQVQTGEAVAEYLNDYRAGIGGRPIELVVCETGGETGRATDCANELIQDGVVLAIMPESNAALGVFTVLSENDIPLFVYGVGDAAILGDTDSTFVLADPLAGLSALPIDVAEENGIDTVSAVVIDVPAATAFYQTIGAPTFEDAGIQLDLITIPPGTADVTPQMIELANGDPSVVHIIGDESLCIATLNGLEAAGFDGPISTLFSCLTDAVLEGAGDYVEGVYVAVSSPLGDTSDPAIALYQAILDEYDAGLDEPNQGATTFITMMAARDALEGLTGDVTPESIIATIKAMPETPLPGASGLTYRCNGQAQPVTPAVCTRGTLRTTIDADGAPVLPYVAVGNSPIPDAS